MCMSISILSTNVDVTALIGLITTLPSMPEEMVIKIRRRLRQDQVQEWVLMNGWISVLDLVSRKNCLTIYPIHS